LDTAQVSLESLKDELENMQTKLKSQDCTIEDLQKANKSLSNQLENMK
jgi:hypothetical protein